MSSKTLATQVKTLEAQLSVLRARLDQSQPPTAARSFGDLYGVFRGKAETTEEELDAAEYRVEERCST